MGRKAGVTAEETRDTLLAAAAKVFARSGYDGASISAITKEAGLSSGAVYTHFASKADLFVAVLDTHLTSELQRLLGPVDEVDLVEFVAQRASTLDRREARDVSLLVEGIVASKRDEDVAEALRPAISEREAQFAKLISDAQADHLLSDAVTAAAVARFSTMLGLGSLLTGALGLPEIDHDEWAAAIAHLIDSIRVDGSVAPPDQTSAP